MFRVAVRVDRPVAWLGAEMYRMAVSQVYTDYKLDNLAGSNALLYCMTIGGTGHGLAT
jgi:hypothetical protein